MKKHANQVTAFEQLLGQCNAQGAFYNPSKESMKSTALNALLVDAQKSVQAVHNAQRDLAMAINARSEAFEELPLLGTRLIRSLNASDASPALVAEVNRIRQRFRFLPRDKRATAQTSSPGGQTGQTTSAEASSTSVRSISQLDFNSKIDNFTAMISFLEKESAYQPNEPALSLEGLIGVRDRLIEKHQAVIAAKQQLFDARKERDNILYGGTGIYGISTMVKKYFGAIYGSNDRTFNAVRKIKFAK